jgi:hypothetical protein
MSSTGPPHSFCAPANAREYEQAAAAAAMPKNCLRFIEDSFVIYDMILRRFRFINITGQPKP